MSTFLVKTRISHITFMDFLISHRYAACPCSMPSACILASCCFLKVSGLDISREKTGLQTLGKARDVLEAFSWGNSEAELSGNEERGEDRGS